MKVKIEQKTAGRSTGPIIFEDKSPITIGRDSGNDVVFNAPEDRIVSTLHARIIAEAGRAVIEDNDSLNGLFVDDRKVSSAELGAHTTVQLGEAGPRFEVTVEGLDESDSGKTMPMPAPEMQKKQYGERTVGMMIKKALAQAGLLKPAGTSKSTDYFEALMDRKIKKTSSKVRWIVAGVIALVVAGGVGVGLWVRHNRSVQYIQTTQVNYGDAAGSAIAAANRYNIFLMVGNARSTQEREGFCTAFAISQNVLATNAHCITTAIDRYEEVGVLMNGAPSNWYPVAEMVPHPGYQDGRISPDVGLVLIKGQLAHFSVMASKAELAGVGPGVSVFLYGFPGRLNRLESPEATFINGQIGRVTGFDQRLGDFGNNTLLQHSAFSSQGTSGSPIFNSDGRVVGINAGGYTENGKALPGYNFAMRIDLVDSLLEKLQ